MVRCQSCGLRLKETAPTCPVHGEVKLERAAPAKLQRVAAGGARACSVDSEPPEAPPPALPGYELKRVLGRGGFGVVYQGVDAKDGATVAVKVSLPDQPGAVRRLAHEGELLVAIGPPFVPAVRAQGKVGTQHYVVMDFVRAPTLADRLIEQAGPLPLPIFASYAQAMLDAVDAVHARGFVHADLKPENIFIDQRPQVWLIDFGSARGGRSDPAFTRTEELAVGTAEYMAPEQCEGRPDIDRRVDVYSLGVLFYEMLSGAPPFWGNATEVREAHCSRRPPRFPAAREIPTPLEDVVLRCLSKDPERRFGTVKELRDAVAHALGAAAPDSEPLTRRRRSDPPVSGVVSTESAARAAVAPREQRSVGLLFFESASGLGAVRQILSQRSGQIARAQGSQYVAAFGHEVADNPARTALLVAQSLLNEKLAARVRVAVATISVQRRPNGEQRFFSPLFTRKEEFPQASDPAGITLTQSAVDVLTHLPVAPVSGREGLYVPDFTQARDATSIAHTGSEDTLVGRDDALSSLTESARRVVENGLPTLVSVIGDPGYGKSLLAARLAHRLGEALPSARVVTLTGTGSIGGAAYPILRDVLRSMLALPDEPPPDHGRALLSEALGTLGAQLWAAGALVLGWLSADHPEVRVLSAAPGALRSAAARLGGQALRRAALSSPLLLVIDDAHLLEEAALDAVEYAALKEGGALIWAAVFAPSSFTQARSNWGRRAAHAEQLELPALDAEAAAELARRLLRPVEHVPRPALLRIVERTQRVPRLMVELVSGLKRAGLVRRNERGRGYSLATTELEKMPDLPVVEWAASREVEALPVQLAGHARLASVLGERFTIDEVEGLLRRLERDGAFEQAQLDAAVGVRRLIDRGILVRRGAGKIDFRHGLLRETIYRSVPDALRTRIHAAALEMFQDKTQLQDEERLPRLALHAARSGLREQAAGTYLLLAERAQQQHAYLEAELMYTSALESMEASNSSVLPATQGRGLMRFRLGRCEDAVKDLDGAVELAERRVMPERVLELLLDKATILDWMGDYAQSAETARQAETIEVGSLSELLRARLTAALGRALSRAGEKEASIEKNLAAAALAEPLGDAAYETLVIALLLAGADFASNGRFEEAERVLARVIAEAQARGDLLHVAAATNNRSFIWFGLGDTENVIKDLKRVREVVRELGFAPMEFHAEGNLGEVYYIMGDMMAAEVHARAAVEVSERLSRDGWWLSHGELLLARIALYANDVAAVRDLVQRVQARLARAEKEGLKEAELPPTDRLLLSMLELALEHADDERWEALAEQCRSGSCFSEQSEVLETWGRLARRQGRLGRARTALEEALQVANVAAGLAKGRVERELQAIDTA